MVTDERDKVKGGTSESFRKGKTGAISRYVKMTASV